MPTPIHNDAEALELLDSYERRGRAFMLQNNTPSRRSPSPVGTGFSSRCSEKAHA